MQVHIPLHSAPASNPLLACHPHNSHGMSKSIFNILQYDWSSLTNNDIRNHMVTVKNKFDTLQETSERPTPNNKYENFVTIHIKAAAKCIPAKPRAKYKVPW